MQSTECRDAVPLVVPVRARPLWLIVLVAAVGGAAVGAADRWAQDVLPYPFANLANSAAVWALAAFAIGLWVGHRAWPGAAAGVVTLGVAVEVYYAVSVVRYGDGAQSLTAPATQLWLGFAVIVGALFGAAGTWARDGDAGVRAAGLAFAPAVLAAEALNLLRLSRVPGGAADEASTAAIEFALAALVLAALVVFVARDRFDWLRALGCCLPIALLGFGLYTASGYGG